MCYTLFRIKFIILKLKRKRKGTSITKPKRALPIACAASGGSAGIQEDIKTFQEFDVYGISVITAIVGRHPETDKNVHPQTIEAIEAQFHTAHRQVSFDAIKTGMLFSKEVIETTANLLQKVEVEHIVVDPVMVGKLDSKLLKDDAKIGRASCRKRMRIGRVTRR